jgi:hypothetical protein
MSDAKPDSVVARAERMVNAEIADRRRMFGPVIGRATADFSIAGGFGGSGHRRHLHQLCAKELHERARVLARAFLNAHTAIGACASQEHRRSAKGWIARTVKTEAGELQQFLWAPRAALGETGEPDDLQVESIREIEIAYARIDNEFDRLERDRVERLRRWVVRASRAVSASTSRR